MSVLTPEKTTIPVTTDRTPTDYDGWFCISTDPWPCACGNFTALHVTCAHLIIVWPSIDDPNLLEVAVVAQKANRHPKVVEYEKSMGKCVSYYQWRSDSSIQPH